jgi:ArsR family transcriptional regulator, arsenate/arsenite/antimonite-responsive transcriptional repressor
VVTPEEAAAGFAALGAEPRLAVLHVLVRAGREGLAIGEIQSRLGIPASTLAHHLRFLAGADLIEQTRDGRTVLTRARFDRVEALAGWLTRECCADAPRVAPRKESR